jgi:hypothetical protein
MNVLENMTNGINPFQVYKSGPYLNTNPSKLVENTKAFELTIIKELGKLTP